MRTVSPEASFLLLLLSLCLVMGCSDEAYPPCVSADPYDGMKPSGITMDEMLGIASHMSTGAEYDRNRSFEIERSVAAGVSLVRRGFYWPSIEPEDDSFVFEGYDTMVGLLRVAGLAPCALVTRAARWATPGGSPNEIDPSDFADFCARVASRYADDIDLYEIWNEENSERFWSGRPDPGHYGRLLRAAFEAIHRSDPAAQVIFGGMSPLDANLFDPRGVWNFLARVGDAHPDLCEFLDGVAIHPYSFLQQAPPEFSFDLGFYRYPDLSGSIAETRHILEGLGCPNKPIHLTEIGWPSLIIGLERQAAYLARGALLARAAGAASYFWYTFYDEEPVSRIPTEDYFGLYSLPDAARDPDPKPSYEALRGLHTVVGDARYGGDLASALGWGKDTHALVFFADRARTVALWRAGSSFSEEIDVEVPLPSDAHGAWSLFDQNGDFLSSGVSDSGRAAVSVSGLVRYLRFHAPGERTAEQ